LEVGEWGYAEAGFARPAHIDAFRQIRVHYGAGVHRGLRRGNDVGLAVDVFCTDANAGAVVAVACVEIRELRLSGVG